MPLCFFFRPEIKQVNEFAEGKEKEIHRKQKHLSLSVVEVKTKSHP